MQVSAVKNSNQSLSFQGITKYIVEPKNLDDFKKYIKPKLNASNTELIQENPFYDVYKEISKFIGNKEWAARHLKLKGHDIVLPEAPANGKDWQLYLISDDDFFKFDNRFGNIFFSIKENLIAIKEGIKEVSLHFLKPQKEKVFEREAQTLLNLNKQYQRHQKMFDSFLKGKPIKQVYYRP